MPKPKENDVIVPRLVKVKQASSYLGISPWKLRNLVQQGKIPFIEDGGGKSPWRFDIRDLDDYIEHARQRL
jgi:excisionase family DNA binding protein